MGSGSSIISGISGGIINTYSLLANFAGSDGVTLKSISSVMSNTQYAGKINPTFASYIQSNFNTLDKDKDGVLSSEELSNMTSMINMTGLTLNQLSLLGTASGLSTETLQKVIEHFQEIDKNGDGKVTTAEINSYTASASKMQKEDEFRDKFVSDMSMFYGDDTSSNTDSILSYRYKNI